MADNLPLLPEKSGAVCADVREVLREVFRELDYLPPPIEPSREKSSESPLPDNAYWIQDSPDHKKLYEQECELQREYAKRLSREPLPNIYRLHKPAHSIKEDRRNNELEILQRRDLRPPINQEAGGDRSLWVQNILNRSSGDLSVLKLAGSRVHVPVKLVLPDENTVQSASFGEIVQRRIPPSLPIAPPPPPPDYIVCIPPRVDFVNFVIGRLYTQSIRLMNISKFEVRLSLRPPAHRELDVQLCSRLVVTSGSEAEIKLHFRPSDVRAFSDELLVRVSGGRSLSVAIACYMVPPILDITIPHPTFSCLSTAITASPTDAVELGTRLLGEVHRIPLLLHCNERHASFFALCEDSWNDFRVKVSSATIKEPSSAGMAMDCFYWWPVRWAGSGSTRGLVLCRGTRPGLHIASMRILCSTAIVRPLNLVADVVLFNPDHVTLEGQDKDYDICSEDDPACDHYVHLGVAFPHRSLAATVKIVNNSPLMYNCYWSLRPWGVCMCREDFEQLPDEQDESNLCLGAQEAKIKKQSGQPVHDKAKAALWAIRVEPASGCLVPCSTSTVYVRVPDAGDVLGVRRAVLMLVLKGVPRESFAPGYDPMIVKTEIVEEERIPGVSEKWSREVCEVVCAQLEVWWQVVPVRFTLDPPLLRLPHSRRVKSVAVSFRSTQLYGAASVRADWQAVRPALPPLILVPQQSVLTTMVLPLKELPNDLPQSHRITLLAESDEWQSSSLIERWSSTRHAALRPVMTWLGVVPPGAPVAVDLSILNDTHQNISWWGTCRRWCRERLPGASCVGRVPCATCHERTCACAALSPTSGTLAHSQRANIKYKVNAPDTDGCVASLVVVGRAADSGVVGARAALLAYRVLAPRLVLRVVPCHGDKKRECEGCDLDSSFKGALEGSALLRPSAALSLTDRSCCLLQLHNLTPLPTNVKWTPVIEGEDIIAVTFTPNEFSVAGHSTVEIQVVLEPKKVCDRRLFIRQATVKDAYKSIYLLVDAAVSGAELEIEFPIGGEERADSNVTIRMSQKEKSPYRTKSHISSIPEEIFAEEDRKRGLQKENICHCHYKTIYVPPVESPRQRAGEHGEYSPVEILEKPLPLTRICPCAGWEKPIIPEDHEPYCLQFQNLPIRTVRCRTLVLRNVSRLDARWRAAVRRWPRRHIRTADKEQWAGDVHAAGVVLQCAPARGRLRPRSSTRIQVAVYTDCWGLYRDQILIQVENIEPLVIDVWIEAVGEPLQFVLRPISVDAAPPLLWMSYSDPERVVHVTNTSRADLTTYIYLLKENDYPQDELPFRLYLRLFDVTPRTCPCATAFDFEGDMLSHSFSSVHQDMDTGVDLFLGPDYGVQEESFYQVEPLQLNIKSGSRAALCVRRLPGHRIAPPTALLLRSVIETRAGPGWYRPLPPLQLLQLREAQRIPQLQMSCSELRVSLCALDLPVDDTLRVRKRFQVQNIGDGPLQTHAATKPPWTVERAPSTCGAHCTRGDRSDQCGHLPLELLARSSAELFVEVSLKTAEVWPTPGAVYQTRKVTTTSLLFYDDEDILLLSVPLILELDMPVLKTEPKTIDFGFVNNNSTRKSYFTVSHSSATATLELVTQWVGDTQFQLYPPSLVLRPGTTERVYVQYTASEVSDGSAQGYACVRARCAAGAWCAASVLVVARRTHAAAKELHPDRTDDPHLLPANVLMDLR